MDADVASVVHLYAPEGPDLQLYPDRLMLITAMQKIQRNGRRKYIPAVNVLEKMLQENKDNVVVMAGNNKRKTEYIAKSVDAGFNVLADKLMAIEHSNLSY
jgi:hypothetical protein